MGIFTEEDYVLEERHRACFACDGQGFTTEAFKPHKEKCSYCQGTGKVKDERCLPGGYSDF